jgi:hypothetical protein
MAIVSLSSLLECDANTRTLMTVQIKSVYFILLGIIGNHRIWRRQELMPGKRDLFQPSFTFDHWTVHRKIHTWQLSSSWFAHIFSAEIMFCSLSLRAKFVFATKYSISPKGCKKEQTQMEQPDCDVIVMLIWDILYEFRGSTSFLLYCVVVLSRLLHPSFSVFS